MMLSIGVIASLSLSKYKVNADSHNKLGEVFRGNKDDKKSKFYAAAVL